MKVDILVPAAGESVTEGDIARWFKASGDYVEMDEPLLELETDKASLEITAASDGILTIQEEEGKTVKVGSAIGYITEGKKKAPAAPSANKSAVPSADKSAVPSANKSAAPAAAPPEEEVIPSEDRAKISTVLDLDMPSPAARKIMAEHQISSQEIGGTGKGGRITKADVLAFLEERQKQQALLSSRRKFIDQYEATAPVISPDETITMMRRPPRDDETHDKPLPSEVSHIDKPTRTSPPIAIPTKGRSTGDPAAAATPSSHKPTRSVRREPMSRIRKTIARRLVEAQQTAALLTTFNEVDMSGIIKIRKKYRDQFKDVHNVGLSFMSFFTTAACRALKEFPIVNAQVEGEDLVYFDYCDIGIAVATPKGLVVPVVRNAESLRFHELERTISQLATKGRNGDLTLEELSGGTFSITNGGVFGSMLSTPIVNHPQSAIMGMHNINDRAVVRNGEVVIRPIMNVALTYDHRLIDGAEAVRFLLKIKALCEDPVKLMLEL